MNEKIEKNFTYHAPKNNQVARYEHVRNRAKVFAYFLLENVPDSEERSIALTRLEEVVFWSNAAIARNE